MNGTNNIFFRFSGFNLVNNFNLFWSVFFKCFFKQKFLFVIDCLNNLCANWQINYRFVKFRLNLKKLLKMSTLSIDDQLNETMDCDNSVQSNLVDDNNNCLSKTLCVKSSSDIVFSNQTNKLIKQSINSHNSSAPVMGKYNLRKKSIQSKSEIKKQNDNHLRGLIDKTTTGKPKKRNSQLSRYKRKNANARERSRVQVNLLKYCDNF